MSAWVVRMSREGEPVKWYGAPFRGGMDTARRMTHAQAVFASIAAGELGYVTEKIEVAA